MFTYEVPCKQNVQKSTGEPTFFLCNDVKEQIVEALFPCFPFFIRPIKESKENIYIASCILIVRFKKERYYTELM